MPFGKMYRRAVKKSGLKKFGRRAYKATGLVNPVKRGNLSSSRLLKDVAMLKAMINAEKKETYGSNITTYLGQVLGNASNEYLVDVTPIIPQGITGQTRNGNSVKIHSMIIQGQILQQVSNHHQGKIRIQLFLNKGTTIAAPTAADIYQRNPMNNLYDYNSPREIDTYKNWSVLCTRVVNIKQDNYAGVQGWKDLKIPLKFKSWHVKYDQTNTNAVTNGQLLMLITCDSGNASTSVTSTIANIPVTGINTGFQLNYFMKYWYYDN